MNDAVYPYDTLRRYSSLHQGSINSFRSTDNADDPSPENIAGDGRASSTSRSPRTSREDQGRRMACQAYSELSDNKEARSRTLSGVIWGTHFSSPFPPLKITRPHLISYFATEQRFIRRAFLLKESFFPAYFINAKPSEATSMACLDE